MPENFFDKEIKFLKGVGPSREEVLQKELQIFTYGDLLRYYPFRYIDRSKFYSIKEINEEMPFIQLRGHLVKFTSVGAKRATMLVAQFRDSTGSIDLVWFKGITWVRESLQSGAEYIVFGKPTSYKGKINIAHPEMELVTPETEVKTFTLTGVYNNTEKCKEKNLDSRGIHRLQKTLVQQLPTHIPETLPAFVMDDLKLLPLRDAYVNIHLPENQDTLKKAQFRLKFEELFYIQLKLLQQKKIRLEKFEGKNFSQVGNYFNAFYREYLPFPLTNAQKRVIREIRADVGSGKQMSRLLQGDVGSGKTVVALMCMLIGIDNGFQTCLMAPTEILAQQHFNTLNELCNGMDIRIELLTGSTKTAKRNELLNDLAENKIHILTGTHALIEDRVQFHDLGLVVIDEQHRFGVEQRGKLWMKEDKVPHVLVMTATPIPRTLAMTLYGDLDISILDEMPPGRKPIQTFHRFESSRLRVFGFLKEQIKQGRQIYIVYPLIDESEKMDYANLMEGYDAVTREFPLPEYRVSIVHGKMKAADKDYEMQQFVSGKTHIMVATSVIEVGVNVPNASVMVIESAQRFGLSQLHQLRGRVGRGGDQSYCLLMTDYKLSSDAKERLETMVRTNDGFEIAEVDLKLRGPGDLTGTQQSGLLNLHIADLLKDQKILEIARRAAMNIMEKDPHLVLPDNITISNQLMKEEKRKGNWSRVS